MPEMNLIIPYCCISGNYCAYNTGIVDGYLLGIGTMFLLFMIIQCLKGMEELCDNPKEGELDEEEAEEVVEEVDEVESDKAEEVEKTEEAKTEVEKSEEAKKDD
jgi:hypothetical protein